MILNCPQKLKHFFQKLFCRYSLTETQREYIKTIVCAIILNSGISMTIIGKTLSGFQRNKSSVSRVFQRESFTTDELAWKSAFLLIHETYAALSKKKQKIPWVLDIDTTHRSRFGKLLENLISNHGEKSKSRTYAFIWGMLLAPNGTRISLPCPIWLTPKFAKIENLERKTQPELTVELIKELSAKLKEENLSIRVVVVADSAFECKKLWAICRKLCWPLITSCDEGRCLGSEGAKASRIPNAKVHQEMQNLPIQHQRFYPFDVVGIQERSDKKTHPKKDGDTSHIYAYSQKRLRIANIGTCKVVRSHKLRFWSQDEATAPVKVLLCSDFTLSAKEVISYFSLRWQIELFFREQKSDFPFNKFCAHDFRSCWKFVDLLCVAFNFLEFFRIQIIKEPDLSTSDCYNSLATMRTRGLKLLFQRHAWADDLTWLYERSKTPFGFRRIREALSSLKIPFHNFELFQKNEN